MAVLCEAISIVIKAARVLSVFGSLEQFAAIVPNQTLAADDELVRVGFMVPTDVQHFAGLLEKHGLVYRDNGAARDFVVVDQQRGPACPCEWLEFGHVSLQGNRVAAARLAGSTSNQLITPTGWQFEGSLSQTFSFVPTGRENDSLRFLREEDGVQVFLNLLTGKEVFVGRSDQVTGSSETPSR